MGVFGTVSTSRQAHAVMYRGGLLGLWSPWRTVESYFTPDTWHKLTQRREATSPG